MLGFLVMSRGPISDRAGQVLARMRTISADAHYDVGPYRVCVFRTEFGNNYRTVTASGAIVVATGTVMLGRARGTRAAVTIGERLERGESLATICAELRGPYTLLWLSPRDERLAVVTDRDGLMACYESSMNGESLVCTSQVLLAGVCAKSIDPLGAQEFVHGGACVDGRTLFTEVKRLPKATMHTFGGGRVERSLLWEPAVGRPYAEDSDARIVDTMGELFRDRLATDRQDDRKVFGADLTAGTDSRTVLSFLIRGDSPVTAATAGDAKLTDVVQAREIARRAGIEHWWYPVESTVEFDDESLSTCIEHSDGAMNPFGLTKQIPYFREKAARFDIQFGGNGGPMFKDHYWLFELNRIDRATEPNWDRIVRYSLTESRVNDALFARGVDYTEHMKSMFLRYSKKIDGANNQKLDFVYFDLKCQFLGSPQYGFANRFLDLYHPMVDGQLVQYTMNIRPWIRLRARLQSELIYRNHPRVAWVLTDNHVPCVPDTGLRYPLRALRAIRYLRAARRKFNDFVLNKRQLGSDRRAQTFAQSIARTAMGPAWERPEDLRIAPLLNLPELSRLVRAVATGAHSGYVQRAYAVEAIVRAVERLGQASLRVPAG